ncbi:MAG: fused response regulator/phosphatase, partial [Firmicutes bacterium]|nr:fused response regulator/phosphatase [Bacillota bacterium]
MRVLIVDDLDSNRLLLSDMVSGFGYQCLSVDDGESAIAAMPIFQPDIVLLDVLMPGRNGLDTAPILKDLAAGVHLPIIFITALDDQQTLINCLAAGGDDFISKPFASVVLEAKLRAHYRNRELNMSLAEKNKALAYHSSRVEREHQIVEHIFQNSLARNYLDYPNLHTYLSPMSMFNGDVLLAAPGPLGNMYIFLGDFTGHGLSAAVGALPISQTFFRMADEGAAVDIFCFP